MNALANIFKIPELRRRILFTLGALAVYRLGVFITTPGVDRKAMAEAFAQKTQDAPLLGMLDIFTGGALEQFSVFALGIMPYVSASIIIQLMAVVVKPLEELRKEGEAGQRKINQYTRYGTIVLSLFQGTGIALFVEGLSTQAGGVVAHPGLGFRVMTVLCLTTGTAFIMWLGEQITERGLGNGTSLIIFSGIVADIVPAIQTTVPLIGQSVQPTDLVVVGLIGVGVVMLIVFFERGQRRLPIHTSRRSGGRGAASTSHLPLRVNSAGVIPPIFASSLLMFPTTLANLNVPGMSAVQNWLSPQTWQYEVVFIVLIVFFCYFYTSVTVQPDEMADNLKKQNAFIPGIRPGKATSTYIDHVLTRITAGGAIYVALVCTIPSLLQMWFKIPFYLGGTSVMIVVGTALDTVSFIEQHLISRHYEGLTGPGGVRIRGRRD